MKIRVLLTFVLGLALCVMAVPPGEANAADLEIGAKAPPLDIEHWLRDGNGFFKPVKKFEPGKVYVVEFWATWCGPCIASMPHLAELQNKYRGRKVQIISVSNETVDEVKDLLGRESEEGGKTFGEITAPYSLTTDPDLSVYKDYLGTADHPIPYAFIVGKTGLVEWSGYPMVGLGLDEALNAVVEDSWDREAYRKELKEQQRVDETMQRVSMLAAAGKFADALALVNSVAESASSDETKDMWAGVRNNLKLSGGMLDDEVLAYFRGQIERTKGDAYLLGRLGFQFYGSVQMGADIGPLGTDVISAIRAELDTADRDLKPFLFNTIAHLSEVGGKLDDAVAAQQAAIDSTDNERQKKRLTPYLEELKEKAAEK